MLDVAIERTRNAMPPKAPAQPIRLLHLSDVHFAAGKAWDADPVLRALARFIGEEVSTGLAPDLVALTGDLAFSGRAEEYRLARDWLENQLWPVLPNLPRDRLLLVPGNHDVDRSAVTRGARSIQSDLLDSISQEVIAEILRTDDDRNSLLRRHFAYLDFQGSWLDESQTLPWWQRSFEIRGTRLHVAGLDSAFMAHGDQDRSNLLIGRYQINQTVQAPEAVGAAWRLALLHHPWDYLAEWDGHEARAAVHQHCDLLLRGHLHFPQTERILPPEPNRACVELAGGCLYEHGTYPNAFQWIELYPQPRRIQVLYRAWLYGAWTVDRNQPGCPHGVADYALQSGDRSDEPHSPEDGAKPAEILSTDLPELPRYREAALSLHGILPIAGFKTKARVTIQLDELYIPLQAMLDSRFSGGCEFADAKDAEDRLRPHGADEIPLIEAFRAASERNRRGLVILGDPGSGKTTHLKRLLLACLKSGPESLGLPAGTIPVFLPLRDLEDLGAGVEAFIARTLDNRNLGMPDGFGSALLERCRLLLLFDGLDEVADPERRARVSDWIEDVARHRPNCLAVVTCRFAGYAGAVRLSAEFLELHLRPLTPEQSDTFIRNWYRVVKTSQAPGPAALAEAAEEAERLIVRLREPDFRSARMAEMTRNPLLLANLCLVHYDRKGILPRGRHELYDECIEVLLELWRRDKRLSVSVSAQVGRVLLGPVALWLHGQEGRTRASLRELTPVLEAAISREKWPGDAAAFLRAVRDESGLLTGWGQDHYGFMHLGFQEYLAAMEIRRRVLADLVAGQPPAALTELASHYGHSWWQEVILLLLAQGDPPLFEPFMQAALLHPDFDAADELTRFILEEASGVSAEPFKRYLRDRQPPTATDWTAGWMAARCIEALTSPEEWMAFLQTLPDTTWAAMSVSSGGIGEWLNQGQSSTAPVQSSRNGGIDLVAISAGRFLMGSPPGVGHDDERPQHEVSLQPFLLGRYPVTNAEYRRYLEANPDAKEPEFWGDRRFNQDRQPVVGVDWDDAQRFCAWAGGRLPTEAEWEYACRAGTVTAFHWGDDEKQAVQFAWFGEDLNNGGTHPVGGKRPNPWGLHDLTGNVWEWTQDLWHDCYDGAPADGSAWTKDGDRPLLVIRGGSWFNVPANLRSAGRLGGAPDFRFDNLGFRLAQDL